MNDLQIFKNDEFGQIRTVDIDGQIWFVGKDIAQALGYSKEHSFKSLMETELRTWQRA